MHCFSKYRKWHTYKRYYKKYFIKHDFILPSYVFLLIILILILLLTCTISSQIRLKNHVDEKSMKDT
ncbi:hypothetical protein COI75_20740 [Bacillus cereus]|nr:hypothetical protein COI75_20740 [Bacillus cereus]